MFVASRRATTIVLPLLSSALSLFTPYAATPSAAGTFVGAIHDSATGSPIDGARVLVAREDGTRVTGALTDADGVYSVEVPEPGRFLLQAARLGYARARRGPFLLGTLDSARVDFSLAPGAIRLEPLVVTVSRRPERAGDAPAGFSLLTQEAILERPAVAPTAHLRDVAGLDIAATGLTQSTAVVRGFGSAQSAALLPLVDYRYANLPALRYSLFHFQPTPNEDLERIEILRGPGAAVYGPNSDRGVVHFITRSPFDAPGLAGAITGGEREIAHGSFRYARPLGSRLAVKIGGQYFRGREWPDRDSVETARREAAIASGANPSTLLVGRRETRNERVAGEGALEWRGAGGATATLSAGRNHAHRSVELTALGAAQVRDWASTYAQLRGQTGGFFGQAFVNASDAGDTYLIRSGSPIRDHSRFFALQAQQRVDPFPRFRLTAGVDAEWTDPRTDGTITGRNEADDRVRGLGAYGHGSCALGSKLTAVAALRLDDHDRLKRLVLSPRAALTYEPLPGRSLRLTYNRAFGTPTVDDLFADLVVDSLPLPFAVRVVGVPREGFHFQRSNGVPLMRSPFTDVADGGPAAYRPLDATLYWNTVVGILQSHGIDLSAIPAPTASDVSTALRTIEADGSTRDVSSIVDLPPLEPTITNSVEIGFRGLVTDRLGVELDCYRTWIENFIGHLHTITPNAFLDPQTLAAYLVANGLSPADAAAAATAATAIPVGSVTPIEARDPTDLILAVQNFGSLAVWGSDLTAVLQASDRIALRGTFSWVSKDFFRRLDGLTDLALNAPGRKGSISIGYRDPTRGVTGEVRYRAAASFPVLSGVYAGTVEAYGLMDCGGGIRVGRDPPARLELTVENVLGKTHREFLGAPRIGRLALARLSVAF